MQHVLAATDFSTRSQRALRRAGRLAQDAAANLTLVHVVEDDQPTRLLEFERAEGERYLREQASVLVELRELACRIVVTTGHPAAGILLAANEAAADLIVMGTHRKQVLRDVFVGTTIERIIRMGARPVLMVNTEPEARYEHVLVPVDASAPSINAMKTAQALGLLAGREVTLLHAFAAVGKGKLELAGIAPSQIAAYVAEERRSAGAELSAFMAANDIDPRSWSFRLEEGPPVETISRAANLIGADLIVVGTRGRSGLAKMFLGSVAEEVMRLVNHDILAVPPVR